MGNENTSAETEGLEGGGNDRDCMGRGMRRVGVAQTGGVTWAGGVMWAGGAAWAGDALRGAWVGAAWAGALPCASLLSMLKYWQWLSGHQALLVCQIALLLHMGHYQRCAYG